MPITQTVTLVLPTYAEILHAERLHLVPKPSMIGLAYVAYYQQQGSKQMPYVDRRAALLSARAKWSIVRSLSRS